jgi:hypothetical protein
MFSADRQPGPAPFPIRLPVYVPVVTGSYTFLSCFQRVEGPYEAGGWDHLRFLDSAFPELNYISQIVIVSYDYLLIILLYPVECLK